MTGPYNPVEPPRMPSEVNLLQTAYDHVLPENSLVECDYDGENVEHNDFSVNVGNKTRIDISKAIKLYNAPKYRKPRLRTILPIKKRQTQRETLTVLNKRNCNVPELAGVNDVEDLVDTVLDWFLDNCCVADVRDRLLGFQVKPATPSIAYTNEWLEKAKGTVLAQLLEVPEIIDREHRNYIMMVKSDVKARGDFEYVNNYPTLQSIVYQSKDINSLFCPLFCEIKDRFTSILKPNIKYYQKKSIEQMEQEYNDCLSLDDEYWHLENDISKYDKSQQEFAHDLANRVYEKLGIDKLCEAIWNDCHLTCDVKAFSAGVKTTIRYQQKSGDATTSLKNTIVNMITTLFAYGDVDFDIAVFLGDDSHIVYKNRPRIREDAARIFEICFNLKCKTVLSHRGYFCSMYICKGNNRWRLLPDPIKLIEKLGNKSYTFEDSLEDRYTSFRDYAKSYNDQIANEYCASSVASRHRVDYNVCAAINTLYSYGLNRLSYLNLWY